MAFDKYVKVKGSERKPLPGATQTGSVDPNEVMQVTLTLRPKAGTEAGLLGQTHRQRPAPVARRVRSEIRRRSGGRQQVEAFAGAHGLAVAQVNLAARSVILTGKCADFEKAFQVQLARYEYRAAPIAGAPERSAYRQS